MHLIRIVFFFFLWKQLDFALIYINSMFLFNIILKAKTNMDIITHKEKNSYEWKLLL